MENCLVTKLHGVIGNDALLKIGELRFNVSQVSDPVGAKLNLTIANYADYETKGVTYDGTSVSNNNGSISFFSKYDITLIRIATLIGGLHVYNTPEDVFNGMPKLVEFKGEFEDTFDISDFYKFSCPLLREVSFERGDVKGDISGFSESELFEWFSVDYCNLVNGAIESLGKLTRLATLRLTSTNVSGSLHGLADGQVSNGRTSGTLTVICSPLIKLNSSDTSVIGNGESKTITFDSSLPDGYSIS